MSEFVFFVYLIDATIKCIKWCIFWLSVSGNAKHFPAAQAICKFGNSLKVVETSKLCGLDLIFV